MPETIPWDHIGAKAAVDYHGDGLTVTPTADRAKLHCVFQRLDGEATREGLWLVSTVANQAKNRFRVTAVAVGRSAANGQQAKFDLQLPQTGEVAVNGQTVRFRRPGLLEEYSVSVDGVRQDFVVAEKPAGAGELQLQLEVAGAVAELTADGARLALGQFGRKIDYSRLRAADAAGRELPAHMEVTSPNRLAVVIDDAGAAYPVRIDPTFSDANWFSLGGIAGVNNTVAAVAVDGTGNLYIGGVFTIVGNMFITNLAEWNGSSWSAVGSGVNGTVDALVFSGGNLYAGGAFTTAGGKVVNHIAVWNGSDWSALGGGMNNTVFTLTTSGGNLYAGGFFTMATNNGPVAVNVGYIAEWNGNSWTNLGIGMNSTVVALATLGTNVVAGGQFTYGGYTPAPYIAEWNGTTWLALAGGLNSSVTALAVSGTNLFVGGNFKQATNSGPSVISTPYIAEWNGSSWTNLALGLNNSVESLGVSGANLFVGGYFTFATNTGPVAIAASLIAEWNGSSWSALGTGVGQVGLSVTALGFWGGNLIAGGGFTRADTVGADNLAQWDGANWSPVVSGLNNSVAAVVVMGTNLFIGGGFLAVGNNAPASYIAQWTGSGWAALGSGVNGTVNALAVYGTNLVVGGAFTTAGGLGATNIAAWNGSAWSPLDLGIGGAFVQALAVLGTNLFASGMFTTAGGVAATNIAEWNGSSWSPVGLGIGGFFVDALAVSGTNLYAGGIFTTAGSIAALNIAHWDGNNWSALGGGVNSIVNALAVSGNDLFAGGSFTVATNNGPAAVTASHIAQWDGSNWSALGGGMNNTVSALAMSGANLYAGGAFTVATNSGPVAVSASHIAQWDGSNWSALGSGANNTVSAMTVSGAALYVGGSFTTAGGKVSGYVAGAVPNADTWLTIQANVPGPNTNTLTYAGFPASQYVVQYTTNLTTGPIIKLATNTPAINGIGTLEDPAATDEQRFYYLSGP